jgi:hypothetical protein
MPATPETRYARVGDAHSAYQVVGDRGPDLLFVPLATFPIDLLWDEPTVAGHLHRLSSFSRLILTDLVASGSSDPVPINDHPAMQSWTDGLVAVLDAVGTGAMVDLVAPSWAGDAAKRRSWARCERLAGGPGYFKTMFDLFIRTDLRPVLESIQAPTLLLHPSGDRKCVSSTHGISPSGSSTRDWWSSTATTTSGSPATQTACWTRSNRSSPVSAAPHHRTACCRPCCSPTSSDRPNAQRYLRRGLDDGPRCPQPRRRAARSHGRPARSSCRARSPRWCSGPGSPSPTAAVMNPRACPHRGPSWRCATPAADSDGRRNQSSAASGSRTSNRAPLFRLHADSVPRCACTNPAAMARPSPDPLGSDESARGTRPLEPR